jgi:trans-aconitate methyltransferase
MTSTHRSYFDEMYRHDPDPWGFESSDYEKRKYALTMACLPQASYESAYEPGCSIGILTEQLALRCANLTATDIVPDVVERARKRLNRMPHVGVELHAIPDEWPEGHFDLVVLSEIAYYFDASDLKRVMSRVIGSTTPGAHIIAVHWRGTTDYPLSADEAHSIIGCTPGLTPLIHHLEQEFVLDVWERKP